MKLGEFFVELGIQGGDKAVSTIKDLVQGIGNLPLEAAAAIVAIGGIEYSLTQLTVRAVDTAISLQHFTDQTGLSGQELQHWQGAAEQANISAESLQSSVAALEKNMAEIRLGRGNISPFQMLGIGVNQNAFGVLRQIRESIKGMNPAMATNLISQMGISPEMISLLKVSNSEFERMMKSYHGLSRGQETTFLNAKKALVEFNQQIRQTAFTHIEVFIRAMEKLWGLMSKFQTEMPMILTALALIAAAFFPLTAAVAGFILVLDDLAGYFAGEDSITGRAVEGFKKLIQELKNAVPETLSGLSKVATKQLFNQALIAPLAIAGPGIAGAIGAGALQGKGGNVFNIVIHATAKAEEVAEHVVKAITKKFDDADQHINNQGH